MDTGWWYGYGICLGLLVGQVGLWIWLILAWVGADLRGLAWWFGLWWLAGGG